jgi:hypothetical protein
LKGRFFEKKVDPTLVYGIMIFPIAGQEGGMENILAVVGAITGTLGLAETIISKGYFVTADHHELDLIEKNEKINFTWIR